MQDRYRADMGVQSDAEMSTDDDTDVQIVVTNLNDWSEAVRPPIYQEEDTDDAETEDEDEDEWQANSISQEVQQKESDALLRADLANWGRNSNVSRTLMTSLLAILKTHGHEQLPKCGRTVLGRKAIYEPNEDGTFIYCGVANALDELFDIVPNFNEDTIVLHCNIDGLPLAKPGFGKQFYPLLISTNVCPNRVSIVALHCNDVGLSDEAMAFEQFVDEMLKLMTTGYSRCVECRTFTAENNEVPHEGDECPEKVHNVKISYFTCDIPATSLAKSSKGILCRFLKPIDGYNG
jgi:hypothetical protein